MSENIQSISQGTYTIGQTSATNFIAGPGITIDQPSAGTVRIGSDETVLWSGAYNNTGISLTEQASNFELLRIHYLRDGVINYVSLVESNNAIIRYGGALYDNTEGAHLQECGGCISSNNGIDWRTVGAYRRWGLGTSLTGTQGAYITDKNYITKIVGINRKEV